MKINDMIIKHGMIRHFFLLGLSLILTLNSCQSNQKNKTENQLEANDNIDSTAKAETVEESKQADTDTLTVQDGQLEDERSQSHIKLDFAKAIVHINDTSQVRLIDEICAISVIPDTSWINKKQLEMGDNWDEVVSDNQYYEQVAIDTLEKLDIPTFYAPREKRYIRLIKADESDFTIDLTKMEKAWGLILFNGNDNPVLWSGTEIDAELKEIYKK
ncbi:hypothetical protein [Pseudozobellia sp. WGM2]|uniref:hypothetical protein n=1 Tax=Pseudozobellia sp. WGM2 TaxID=2787625 RepID=UPI001AE0C117|nr:hypothetical protein [Pseudozobellia sp. WGM2]